MNTDVTLAAGNHLYRECHDCNKLVRITGILRGLHLCRVNRGPIDQYIVNVGTAKGKELDRFAGQVGVFRLTSKRRFWLSKKEKDHDLRNRIVDELGKILNDPKILRELLTQYK